jgi:hypothetical protein
VRTTVGIYTLTIAIGLVVSVSQNAPQPHDATQSTQSGSNTQLTIPDRPSAPLFQGQQGNQRSEVAFNPSNQTVTLKLQVQDPNGYFLPNIRRENFAVYEDDVRQKNVTVEIEHSPIVAALLLEFGGRYLELNKLLGFEIPRIGRNLLDDIGRDDKLAVMKYSDHVETLVDFNQSHQALDGAFDQITVPKFSEANFYDALVSTTQRMQNLQGRKAIIAVSSGIDTFSKASYEEVLEATRNSSAPVYIIGLTRLMAQEASVYGSSAPYSHIDWKTIENQIEALAQASGGRAYLFESDLQIPGIYDDIMENLRLRYVITYVSSNSGPPDAPRKIRVALIDPQTGGPLEIHDADGKPVTAKVLLQSTYDPGSGPGGTL